MFHYDILGDIKMSWNIKKMHAFTHNLGLLKLEVKVASLFATSKMAIIKLKNILSNVCKFKVLGMSKLNSRLGFEVFTKGTLLF